MVCCIKPESYLSNIYYIPFGLQEQSVRGRQQILHYRTCVHTGHRLVNQLLADD